MKCVDAASESASLLDAQYSGLDLGGSDHPMIAGDMGIETKKTNNKRSYCMCGHLKSGTRHCAAVPGGLLLHPAGQNG